MIFQSVITSCKTLTLIVYFGQRFGVKRHISIILMLLCFGNASAQLQQEKVINHQLQFWTSVNSTFRLGDRWGALADAHIRRNNFIVDPSFYFIRFGGVFWLNNQHSFALGPAFLWLATDTEVGIRYALEKRIYQQALWRSKIGKITFLQRIRVEQRWHEVLDPSDGSVDRVRFSNRFRFLFSAKINTFKNPKSPQPVIANEIHFHVGKEIIYNTFDQNRLFLGFNGPLGKDWSFDFGYMMVYQQRYSGYEYDMNHTVRLFFYFTPDFRKVIDQDLPHYPISGTE